MKIHCPSCVFKPALVIVLMMSGSACTQNPVHETSQSEAKLAVQVETFVYECPNDYSFTARVEGEQVWLFLPEKTIDLPHISSASGAKYSDGNVVFWNKGDTAMLDIGSEQHEDCTNNRKKAIWEHAKLNGVDFRAVGNEPGWDLEITRGEQIQLVTDYGQQRFVFKTPEPEIDAQSRKTRYRASQNGKQILIEIEARCCHDTMSDDTYESSVRVMLNGDSYHGCGRALH